MEINQHETHKVNPRLEDLELGGRRQHTGEERRGQDDVPRPALAVDLRVEAAGDVTRHAAGQSVQDDGRRVDGAVAVHVEHPQQRHDDDSYDNRAITPEVCIYKP